MAEEFKLAIWSSADDADVQELVDKIKPAAIDFEFIWGRSRTTKKWKSVTDEYYYVKRRLSKVKRNGLLIGKNAYNR
jgi:RNA polymerase II subunit A small phosphatase-like protein